jgi:hypothetical protein
VFLRAFENSGIGEISRFETGKLYGISIGGGVRGGAGERGRGFDDF